MTNTSTTTCSACHGTGWDGAFDSPCWACGLGQTETSADEARERYTEAQTKVESLYNELDELVAWLGEQENEFARSLAAQYANKRSLSEKQIAAAKRFRERAQDTTTFRWTKVAGEWRVEGPEGHENTEVTVTKASGQTAQVKLGGRLSAQGGKAIYLLPAKGETERTEPEDGFYYHRTEDDIRIYKVQTSQAGRPYAKRLVGTSFEYDGRKAFGLELVKLDAEAAAEFGHLYGVCARCGRTLTDEGSIEAGIGPVCAKKL